MERGDYLIQILLYSCHPVEVLWFLFNLLRFPFLSSLTPLDTFGSLMLSAFNVNSVSWSRILSVW